MRRVWPFVFLVLALPACSEFQTHSSGGYAPVVTRGYGTDAWLAELHHTRQMTADELQQTVTAWEQGLKDDPDTGNRIRLALLLTAGDTAVRDPQRARELLDELDPLPENTSDRELVALLRQMLDEQGQAGLAIRKLKKQVRNQDRRIQELEKQQRALTDIEQNIQQRDILPDLENGGK